MNYYFRAVQTHPTVVVVLTHVSQVNILTCRFWQKTVLEWSPSHLQIMMENVKEWNSFCNLILNTFLIYHTKPFLSNLSICVKMHVLHIRKGNYYRSAYHLLVHANCFMKWTIIFTGKGLYCAGLFPLQNIIKHLNVGHVDYDDKI